MDERTFSADSIVAGSTSVEELRKHDSSVRVDGGEGSPPGGGDKPDGAPADLGPMFRGSTSLDELRRRDQTVRSDGGDEPDA